MVHLIPTWARLISLQSRARPASRSVTVSEAGSSSSSSITTAITTAITTDITTDIATDIATAILTRTTHRPVVRLSNGATCRVTQVTPETITIDANGPMAGKALEMDVTVLELEPKAASLQTADFAGGCFWGESGV
jgi:hypothetical protein